jgi:hypothetical protein
MKYDRNPAAAELNIPRCQIHRHSDRSARVLPSRGGADDAGLLAFVIAAVVRNEIEVIRSAGGESTNGVSSYASAADIDLLRQRTWAGPVCDVVASQIGQRTAIGIQRRCGPCQRDGPWACCALHGYRKSRQ